MAKYILESAQNINWMALFALFTFMFVFIVSCVMVLRRNDNHIQRMAHLPLDEDGELTKDLNSEK